MTESTSVTFDVRGMTPEERPPAIIARMSALQAGETLRLMSDQDLAPLQAHFLAEHPHLFTWEPEQEGPEAWVIRIQKRGQEGDALSHRFQKIEAGCRQGTPSRGGKPRPSRLPCRKPLVVRRRVACSGHTPTPPPTAPSADLTRLVYTASAWSEHPPSFSSPNTHSLRW